MRWLFLLLLLVNIGYVTWEVNREHPPQTRSHVLPPGVERIVLLGEPEPASGQAAKAVATATQTAQKPDKIRAPENLASKQQGVAETGQQKPLPGLQAPGDTVEGVQQAKSPAATKVAKSRPEVDLCYTLGPFSEMKTLRRVTREIKDYVVEASFRSKEEQEHTMFRVFVRPVGSKQEAKALIKELVSKNIRDYFIITDGPNKNGISLGYFSSKGRAYRHADHVRTLGFDATAEPVFRSYTIYWLDYRIKSGNAIPADIVDAYLENSTQRLSRDCG